MTQNKSGTVHTYHHNEASIDYRLVYKKRKTLGIYIDVYGNIELRVPPTTKEGAVHRLLEEKWAWILRHQQEQREKTKGFKEKIYRDGEEMLYLGQHYPLKVIVDATRKNFSVALIDEALVIQGPGADEDQMKQVMTSFYKKQCKQIIDQRIRYWQSNFKVKPRKISIRSNKKHWGTCNSNRELTFNWRLAMAPLSVVDYVVVHELCHMVHMNHDRSFWRLVGKLMPDYKEKMAWLEQSHWKMVV